MLEDMGAVDLSMLCTVVGLRFEVAKEWQDASCQKKWTWMWVREGRIAEVTCCSYGVMLFHVFTSCGCHCKRDPLDERRGYIAESK